MVIGASLFGSIMLIVALSGPYTVAGTNSLSELLGPLLLIVSSAVLEKILFRGVLFRIVERSLGSWIALAMAQ